MSEEYVYIVHVREFVNQRDSTYKIGMTRDSPNSRMIAYPKGSVPIECAAVVDAAGVERDLIQCFTDAFVLRREYGAEYFTGPIMEMLLMFNSIVCKHRIKARMSVCKPLILNDIAKEKAMLEKTKTSVLLLDSLSTDTPGIPNNFIDDLDDNYVCPSVTEKTNDRSSSNVSQNNNLNQIKNNTEVVSTSTQNTIKTIQVDTMPKKTAKTFFRYIHATRLEWYLEGGYVMFDVIEDAFREYFEDYDTHKSIVPRQLGPLFIDSARAGNGTKKKLRSYEQLRKLFQSQPIFPSFLEQIDFHPRI